jgi:hypothetical protein
VVPGGTLDWWVKERREWLGRVRGPDGRQKWIKAADLRPRLRECVSPVGPATFTAANRRQLRTSLPGPLLHVTHPVLDVIAYPVVGRARALLIPLVDGVERYSGKRGELLGGEGGA